MNTMPILYNESNSLTKNDNITDNSQNGEPYAQVDQIYDPVKLPFFENDSALANWVILKLINNLTLQDSLLFFAESDRTGDIITDSNMYFEDFAVLLDGILPSLGVNDIGVASYFQTQRNFPRRFWDLNSSSAGYYSWINEDLTQNSSIKDLNSNIQPIFTFIDWFETQEEPLNNFGTPAIISTQWNVLKNQFSHTIPDVLDKQTITFFNQTTEWETDKYFSDQFLAAMAGFRIHRANTIEISDATKNEGLSYANAIMNTIMNSTFIAYDENYGTFNYKRAANMRDNAFADIDLLTNTYGMLALLEWSIESGIMTPENKNKTQLAIKVFDTLNRTLWNTTHSLFMEMSTQSYSPFILNSTISVRNNAIMMSALKRLFEITGNFTYLETIMKMYEGLKNSLYDEVYGNYYKSLDANTYPLEINQNKSLNTHAYLYRAFHDISKLSDYSHPTITLNQTSLIKGQDTQLNATFLLALNIILNYSQISYVSAKNVPIANSSFYYNIRYPNGTLIDSGEYLTGNVNGTVTTIITLQDSYPSGDYLISYYGNYTGIKTKFGETMFSIVSGLSIKNYEFLNGTNQIRAGQTAHLNLTLNSSRADPMLYDIKFISTEFNSLVASDQNLTNNTFTSFSYDLVSLSTAKFGLSIITIELWNNSILFFSQNISITVVSPVEMVSISQFQYLIQNMTNDIIINLKNHLDVQQNCTLQIKSSGLVEKSINFQLGSLAVSEITLSTDLIDNIYSKNQIITYLINITRVSDGEIIYMKYFSAIVKPPIEIIGVQYNSIIYHNQENYAKVIAMNYLDTARNVYYVLDGKKSDKIEIIPGQNIIQISLGQHNNPYDFGEKKYLIQIYEETDALGNTQLLIEEMLNPELRPSFTSLLIGYFLPIGIPVIGMVIMRHISIENKKRLS